METKRQSGRTSLKSRVAVLAVIALIQGVAISSVLSLPSATRLHATATPGRAHLRAVGGRDAQQRRSARSAKFDGTLADLSRHAVLLKPGGRLAELHSMS